MISGMVLPDTEDPDSAPFWAAARERRLVVQRCDGCGKLRFPPHSFCNKCHHHGVTWVPVSGRGRIWSYVIAHSPTLTAYEPFTPYPVVVVELEEDPTIRMVGNILTDEKAAINSVDPAQLSIGLPVEVVFQEAASDVVLPQWRIVTSEGGAR